LTLDENFIRAAERSEPSAAQRARAAREANLRRLLADEAAQQRNTEHAQRRHAPIATARGSRPSGLRLAAFRVWLWRQRALVVFGLVVLIALLFQQQISGDSTTRGQGATAASGRPSNWPSISSEVADSPLGAPPAPPIEGGAHAFSSTQSDGVTPVTYDPCRPIHYVTRPGGPPEGDALVREAIAAVSSATGLVFVDDGPTDEGPSDDREPFQPDRYGDRWAPVLITWSDPAESPTLGQIIPESPMSDVAGFAGPTAVGTGVAGDDELVFVTGSVTLDAPQLTEGLATPGGRDPVFGVIAHEFAHLVGLDHVDDPTQLMFPSGQLGVSTYQAGDLTGLAALGGGECRPTI
jgi:hypothetical protein